MSTKIAKKGGKLMYNPIRVIQYRNKMNKPNKINDINDMVKSILIKIYNTMKNIIHNDKAIYYFFFVKYSFFDGIIFFNVNILKKYCAFNLEIMIKKN
jgi:hypothetical protein